MPHRRMTANFRTLRFDNARERASIGAYSPFPRVPAKVP
jgi:hypothetical protein